MNKNSYELREKCYKACATTTKMTDASDAIYRAKETDPQFKQSLTN